MKWIGWLWDFDHWELICPHEMCAKGLRLAAHFLRGSRDGLGIGQLLPLG